MRGIWWRLGFVTLALLGLLQIGNDLVARAEWRWTGLFALIFGIVGVFFYNKSAGNDRRPVQAFHHVVEERGEPPQFGANSGPSQAPGFAQGTSAQPGREQGWGVQSGIAPETVDFAAFFSSTRGSPPAGFQPLSATAPRDERKRRQ